jgi:hypothetical protein
MMFLRRNALTLVDGKLKNFDIYTSLSDQCFFLLDDGDQDV